MNIEIISIQFTKKAKHLVLFFDNKLNLKEQLKLDTQHLANQFWDIVM